MRLLMRLLFKLRLATLFTFVPKGSYCVDESYPNGSICFYFDDWHCRITGNDIVFGRTSRLPMKDRYGCPFKLNYIKER